MSFDKISIRIQHLAEGLEHIEPLLVAQKVIQGVYDGVSTTELDTLAAETSAYMSTINPNYEKLAARLAVSNLHKETKTNFLDVVSTLRNCVNARNGKHSPLISPELQQLVEKHHEVIQTKLNFDRDFQYSYFGFKTLCRSYLLRIDGNIVERPQHMLMRVALGIHGENFEEAFRTYDLMSRKIFTHASPTMFNAGTMRPQCSSCFLLTMNDDSIEGIYETLAQCARISKSAGGIGLDVHQIRAAGSYIAGTNGNSNGLTPLLRVFNATARYVDQGGGKRKGAFAIYLEPWHADIFDVMELKKNTGPEELRARDLFYGLWIPDLFMKRVESNGTWSLMCPDECPGLYDSHSEEFEALYERYESEGKFRRQVPAQQLWFAILESQIETGTPYMLYKDSCNRKSNQQNLGTIRGSNLCTEIIQYTSVDEIAVCNLASVALNSFVRPAASGQPPSYDFQELYNIVFQMTRNLNRVIDVNFYPVEQARNSNMRHRPIGLGVQGLADTFFLMRYPFESEKAAELNRTIFETMYFAACTASMELAKADGHYETYPGSPASKGQLQFDLWNVKPSSGLWDWASLKAQIAQHGLRNSLLLAPMPTASTAQILGNTECFEPISSNIYSRNTLAGSFTVINNYLVEDLRKLGLWNKEMKNMLVANGGSVQGITSIPEEIRNLYKTVWEIKQRAIIDMAADRGAYIDQSASLNIHMAEPTFPRLTSLHFHTWKKGLKTGMYYLRTRPAANAIQFTVDKKAAEQSNASNRKTSFGDLSYKPAPEQKENFSADAVCTMEEGCLSCGS